MSAREGQAMSDRRVQFEKWEGLGNDFLLIEAPSATLSDDAVQRLCDRRRGVGGDGVLFIEGAASGRPRMIVRNADGSRPEMCGNGLRCVAAYLLSAAPDQREAGELVVLTDAGERRCAVTAEGPGAFLVTVGMGVATLKGAWTLPFEGAEHAFALADAGNPHAITFAPYDEATIDRLGPHAATTPPRGINVEFCTLLPSDGPAAPPRIQVVVWERGVGRTLACGTGACAVAAVACATGRAPFDAPVKVLLPGGELEISVMAETLAMSMKGPARRVFRGEITLA